MTGQAEDMFTVLPVVEDTGCREGLALAVAFWDWERELEVAA